MDSRVEIISEPQGDFLRRWFRPLLEQGSTFCAPNLNTQFAFLRTPQVELPLTFNEAEWGNSWICSPWTQYISYALQEISWMVPPWQGKLAAGIFHALGQWLRRADFNRVVMVNNWLLSTAPWPQWSAEELPEVLAALIRQWPDHAILFRSLNKHESGPLIRALRLAGACLIPSRQIWWFAPDSEDVARSRDYRSDVRLLHKKDLERVDHDELQPGDFPALKDLYDQLYLKKYSLHNPQFTTNWLQYAHAERLLQFTALRQASGKWAGVEACAEIHGTLTSPIVGYDSCQPKELGLYRRLAVLPVIEGRRRGLSLNLSAGVGKYKALRGGKADMEYLAVFHHHLPSVRRRPWWMVQWISDHLLAPVVKRKQL